MPLSQYNTNGFKITATRENVIFPKRATFGSAGLDIFYSDCEDLLIKPGQTKNIRTRLFIQALPESGVISVHPKSGLFVKHKINVEMGIYSETGKEIIVKMSNNNTHSITFKRGLKIAQMIFRQKEGRRPVASYPIYTCRPAFEKEKVALEFVVENEKFTEKHNIPKGHFGIISPQFPIDPDIHTDQQIEEWNNIVRMCFLHGIIDSDYNDTSYLCSLPQTPMYPISPGTQVGFMFVYKYDETACFEDENKSEGVKMKERMGGFGSTGYGRSVDVVKKFVVEPRRHIKFVDVPSSPDLDFEDGFGKKRYKTTPKIIPLEVNRDDRHLNPFEMDVKRYSLM